MGEKIFRSQTTSLDERDPDGLRENRDDARINSSIISIIYPPRAITRWHENMRYSERDGICQLPGHALFDPGQSRAAVRLETEGTEVNCFTYVPQIELDPPTELMRQLAFVSRPQVEVPFRFAPKRLVHIEIILRRIESVTKDGALLPTITEPEVHTL